METAASPAASNFRGPPASAGAADLHAAEIWSITWSRGFQVLTSASTSAAPAPRAIGANLVQFHFQLDGEGGLRKQDGTLLACPAPGGLVIFHPMEGAGLDAPGLEAGGRFVSLFCTEPFLRQLLVKSGFDPERLFRRLAAGDGRRLGFNAIAVTAARDLLQCDAGNGLNRLRAEAKSLELLCGALDALERAESGPEAPLLLSARDLARLEEARELIRTRISDALTIPQLARLVGLNQQKLKLGFKHRFGQTIFEFSTGVRMAEALRLLQSEAAPVGVVAAQVGYRCAGSFSRAFERHHGYLPRTVRRCAVG